MYIYIVLYIYIVMIYGSFINFLMLSILQAVGAAAEAGDRGRPGGRPKVSDFLLPNRFNVLVLMYCIILHISRFKARKNGPVEIANSSVDHFLRLTWCCAFVRPH